MLNTILLQTHVYGHEVFLLFRNAKGEERVSVFFQASCSGENVFTSFMYNFERENYYYLTTVFYNQRWEQPRSQGLSGERPKETLGTSLRWENFNYSIYFVSLMR